MTMVLPSPYDVVDTLLCPQQLINHYSASSPAAVYGGEIDSIRRLSTSNSSSPLSSSSPAALLPNHCNSSQFVIFDEMADDLIRRPDADPNQPTSSSMVDDSWLRLRLGSSDDQPSSSSTRGLVELDLLPATTTNSLHQQVTRPNTRPPPGLFHMQPAEFREPPRPVALLQRIPAPEVDWALMRPNSNIMMTGHHQQQQQIMSGFGGNYYMANNPAAASMSLLPLGPNFFARPNFGATQMGLNGGRVEGGSGGMRIIRPPRRPHVGVWFMLQALHNQVREPFLPQIPKSYLRIKNGRMTVRLLMKYLVQKLGLESESEVEIRCRGQDLQPNLTLQHVRDNIWCTRRDMPLTLLSDSPSSSTSTVGADSHIMILHYGRPILSAIPATATTATTSSAPIF